METLSERVKQVLERSFSGCIIELELIGAQERVFGTITWPGFEGKEQTERQSEVWKVLDATFKPDELLKIFGVLTFIPEESLVEKDF